MAPVPTADVTPDPSSGPATPRRSRFMQWWIGDLSRWGVGVAKPVPGPWQILYLHTAGRIDVYIRDGRKEMLAGTFDPSSDAIDAALVARLKRQRATPSTTVLRLQGDDVVTARVPLPASVSDVLDKVIYNYLERLAPWPASEARYDHRVAGMTPTGQLDVELWIAGRETVDRLRAAVTRRGPAPGIIDVGHGREASDGVNLLADAGGDLAAKERRVARALQGLAVVGTVAIVCAIGSYAWLSKRSESLDATVRAALAQASAASDPRGREAERSHAAAIEKRRAAPAMAILVEVLSRALPDDAVLERIEVRDGVVTIAGRAVDPPALVAALEASPHFKNVTFSAPTTRAAGETASAFAISARLQPHAAVVVR